MSQAVRAVATVSCYDVRWYIMTAYNNCRDSAQLSSLALGGYWAVISRAGRYVAACTLRTFYSLHEIQIYIFLHNAYTSLLAQ